MKSNVHYDGVSSEKNTINLFGTPAALAALRKKNLCLKALILVKCIALIHWMELCQFTSYLS